jgi:hypothetical protein
MLRVDLQDGFDGDEVIVKVDGQVAYHEQDVSTLTVIGRAATFTVDEAAPDVDVEVELPERQLRDSFRVDVTATPHLGVSVIGGQLTHRLSTEAFGYM